jgi:hypothetical protein
MIVARSIVSPVCRIAVLLAVVAAPAVSLHAQAAKTITIRMLDARTGRLLPTGEYLVQFDHQQDQRADLVRITEAGAGALDVPPGAKVVSIHGTYDSGMTLFVNCDVVLDKGTAYHTPGTDPWYGIAEILSTGVVAPNGCRKSKLLEGMKFEAKPGEFVFFVRKLSWREQAVD